MVGLVTLYRLVITEPDQTPPALGVDMFPETLTKAQRMALKHTYIPEVSMPEGRPVAPSGPIVAFALGKTESQLGDA